MIDSIPAFSIASEDKRWRGDGQAVEGPLVARGGAVAKMELVPLTIKELKELAKLPDPCPLCERPNENPSDHHLVPKSRGGKVTETICRDCHSAIHATFTNKELEREYATIDALMSHEKFAAMIRHISRQRGKVRTRTNARIR